MNQNIKLMDKASYTPVVASFFHLNHYLYRQLGSILMSEN